MKQPDTCVFCRIASGEEKAHVIWENESHVAFLSLYPNTEGTTVVIPKKHLTSDVLRLPQTELNDLLEAAKVVSNLLVEKLSDVGRVGLIFDGFGINHAHAKLYPMHGTAMTEWRPIHSHVEKYFDKYEGYISSHDYHGVSEETLAALAKRLRG